MHRLSRRVPRPSRRLFLRRVASHAGGQQESRQTRGINKPSHFVQGRQQVLSFVDDGHDQRQTESHSQTASCLRLESHRRLPDQNELHPRRPLLRIGLLRRCHNRTRNCRRHRPLPIRTEQGVSNLHRRQELHQETRKLMSKLRTSPVSRFS